MINKEAALFWTSFVASVILIVLALVFPDMRPDALSAGQWVGIAAVVGMLIGGGIGYFMGDI